MNTYKIADGAGKRFTVQASSRAEAKEKARRLTTAYMIYIID